MGGGGFGGGFRPPITVQMAAATKGDIGATMTVVGNLIGQQTVDVVPAHRRPSGHGQRAAR